MLPHPISDSIWLAHGALLVGSGRQMCLYGEKGTGVRRTQARSGSVKELPVETSEGKLPLETAAAAATEEEEEEESLFEHVARLNGPLEEYHPQMLLQCLLWGESLRSFLFLLCPRFPPKVDPGD